MTRFVHDQFAKDYLEELLNYYGQVNPSRPVTGEVLEIDVLFFPSVKPLEPDDRELIMRLEPLYQQEREQDREIAKLEERRQIIENMLLFRFGSLDNELITLVSRISALPAKEFTPLLMQLSREELIARFSTQS